MNTNNHKLFRQLFRLERECREILMAPPDKTPESTTEHFERRERERPFVEAIEKHVQDAVARNPDPTVRELWANPDIRKMMIAQVLREGDGTTRWATETSQAQTLAYIDKLSNPDDEISKIQGIETKKIREFAQQLEKNVDALRDAKQAYEKQTGKDFPIKDIDAVQAIIEKFSSGKNDETLRVRNHGLIKVLSVIVNAKTKDELLPGLIKIFKDCKIGETTFDGDEALKIADTPPDLKAKLGDKSSPLLVELAKIFDAETDVRTLKRKMYEKIYDSSRLSFSEAEKKTINDDITALSSLISANDKEQQLILSDLFARQTRYLRLQGGDDLPGFIKNSILLDGNFDMELFTQRLAILGVKVTDDVKKKIRQRGNLDDQDAMAKSVKADDVQKKLKEFDIDPTVFLGVAAIRAGTDIPTELKKQTAKYLQILLNGGKTALKTELESKPLLWQTLVNKVQQKRPGVTFTSDQILDLVANEMLQFWNTGDLEKYMEKDVRPPLNNRPGFDFKKYVLRARLPESVSTFFINAGEKNVGVGDVIQLSKIVDLTKDGPEFTDASKDSLLSYLNVQRVTENMPVSLAKLTNLTDQFNLTQDATSEKNLKDFLIYGFTDNEFEKQALALVVKPATSLALLSRLMKKELITDGAKLAALTDAYKRDPKPANKKALQDFLDADLKDYPLLLVKAKAFVTPATLDELTDFLTVRPFFVDEAKYRSYATLVEDYKANIATPDRAAKKDALIAVLRGAGVGDDIVKEVEGRLDTSNGLSAAAAKNILTYLKKEQDGQTLIEKERFIEFTALLFINKSAPGKNESDRFDTSRKIAEQLWLNLIRAGAVVHRGGSAFVIPDEDVFAAKLTGQKIGLESKQIHKDLRGAKVQDVEWSGAAKMYMHQLGGTLWDTGEKLADYIVNLGSVFTSPRDAELLRSIKTQDALVAAKKSLQESLKASDAQPPVMKAYVAQFEHDNQFRADLLKTMKSASSPGENQKGAEALLEAYARVVPILRAENKWDSLPLPVRQVSIWIAMNKGGGNAEKALQEAKDFLREFYKAPNLFRDFTVMSNRFMVNPGEQQKDELLEALEKYKEAAGEAFKEEDYDEYVEAIGTYAEACAEPEGDTPEEKATFRQNAKNAYILAEGKFRRIVNEYERSRNVDNRRELAHNEYLSRWIKDNPDDALQAKRFIGAFERNELLRGESNVKDLWYKHRLAVRPLAITALQKKHLPVDPTGGIQGTVSLAEDSFSYDMWLVDGHRDQAGPALDLVLEKSPAKAAFIKAFIEGKDVEYETRDASGVTETMTVTAQEAFMGVSEIQRLLQHRSDQFQPAYEYLRKQDFTENPFDKGLRATLDTMSDLWNGDMVDKVKLFIGLFAAYKLITYIWQEGGKEESSPFMKILKWGGLVGIPLMMVANTAYKNQSGRDILGETLLYLPKKDRDQMLEAWKRRGLKYDATRYAFLGHESGHAAMQVLMDRNDPVSVKDLMAWRGKIRKTSNPNGGTNYEENAPKNLRIGAILAQLPAGADRNEAFRIAYLAFEAVCVDVAAMHEHNSGGIDERANWGADYIQRAYIDKTSYDGEPAVQAALGKGTIGIIDVINSETLLPSFKNSVLTDRTLMERVGDGIGNAGSAVATTVGIRYAEAVAFKDRTMAKVPEVLEKGKELVGYSADVATDWFRTAFPKAKEAVIPAFVAAWKALEGTGITIVKEAPGAFKFVLNGAVDISAATLKKLKNFHDYLLLHEGIFGEVRLAKKLEESVLTTLGVDILKELNEADAKRQSEWNTRQVASLLDGGSYAPIDGSGTYTYSQAYRGERAKAISFGKDVGGTFKPFTFDESKAGMDASLNKISNTIFTKNYADITPAQQKFALEVMQANLFKVIANHPEIGTKIQEYNDELIKKDKEIRDTQDELKSLRELLSTKNQARSALNDEIGSLLTKTLPEISGEFERVRSKLETAVNARDASGIRVKQIDTELAAKPGPGAINAAKLKAELLLVKNTFDTNAIEARTQFAKLTTLYVQQELIRVIPLIGDRKKFADYSTKLTFSGQIEIAKIKIKGVDTPLYLQDADATKIRDDHALKVKDFIDTENEIAATKTKLKTATRLAAKLNTERTKLLDKGVDGIQIRDTDLFLNADVATTLAANKDLRTTEILSNVYNEGGRILGVPLKFLLGNAAELATKRIESWVSRRLENDRTYNTYKKDTKNADVVNAYERYLQHVGINEIFVRAMVKGKGYGERESPLHLSYDEAESMDKFLEEQERLASFAKFLEIWEALTPANRAKYLP